MGDLKPCVNFQQYDLMTGEPTIAWVFDESPWWLCIECEQPFFSAVLCICEDCNPFSGFCRGCRP